MSNKKSREAILDFQDYLGNKGLMAKGTVTARKAALNKVLGILPIDEAEDVTVIDLDEVMTRFHNLEGQGYTPGSLKTYKTRVKAALSDFESYLENPLAFKPSLKQRARKSNNNQSAKPAVTNSSSAAEVKPDSPSKFQESNIWPIPLRPDLTIRIDGIPHDLTEAEAKKISNVILAMAMPSN